MRRLFLLPFLCLALVPSAFAADPAKRSWAQPQIKVVTSHGLMGGSLATFRPDAPLTQGALAELAADLTEQEPATPTSPAAPATLTDLDAVLVRALGLRDAAAAFTRAARAAGIAPPARFGNEVVARLLGLRTNHPAGQDLLELLPTDTATRAEAAYSAAQILGVGDWEVEAVRQAALAFELPTLASRQAKILRTAVSRIGFPYVWGGTSDGPQTPFGKPAAGGFDCSGFVWRVYKLQAYGDAPQLSQVLRGRTTMEMSGEVKKAKRVGVESLEPGDVLFFGGHGPRSKPAEVDHAAIYLGNGWLIHSSGYGVALATFSGWYASRFAWARRPLAEAGLPI